MERVLCRRCAGTIRKDESVGGSCSNLDENVPVCIAGRRQPGRRDAGHGSDVTCMTGRAAVPRVVACVARIEVAQLK